MFSTAPGVAEGVTGEEKPVFSNDARALRDLARRLESNLRSADNGETLAALRNKLSDNGAGDKPKASLPKASLPKASLVEMLRQHMAERHAGTEARQDAPENTAPAAPIERKAERKTPENTAPAAPIERKAERKSPEKLEVLAGSVTSMQASLARLRDQVREVSSRQHEAAGMVSGAASEAVSKQISSSMDRLADGLKERVSQSELRNVEAIREFSAQFARTSARIEERQKEILQEVDDRVGKVINKEEFRQALANMDIRLEETVRESRNALEPLRNTIASLARRIDGMEMLASPASPAVAEKISGYEEHGNFASGHGQAAQAAPVSQAAQAAPVPQAAPISQAAPVSQAAQVSQAAPVAPVSQAAPVPQAAAPVSPADNDVLSGARKQLNAKMGGDAYIGSLLDRRSKLPLVAASALALAVAGGGALSTMRGKEEKTEQSQPVANGNRSGAEIIGAETTPAAAAPAVAAAAAEPETDVLFAGAEIIGAETAPAADAADTAAAEPDTPFAAEIVLKDSVPPPMDEGLGNSVIIEKRSDQTIYASLAEAVQAGVPRALYEQAVKDLAVGEKLTGADRMQRAAEAGLAIAQYRMSKLYERGEGVPRSMARARIWAEAAANAGNINAMHDTAVFYAEGDGGKQNYTIAIDWFRKAGAHGLVDSQYNLGVLFEQGLGNSKDLTEAAYWYELAGRSGDPDGSRRAGELARKHRDIDIEAVRARAQSFTANPGDGPANGRFDDKPAWQFPGAAMETGTPPRPSEARTAIARLEAPGSLSRLDIAEVQILLERLGYSPGAADGIVGQRTRRAIMAYEFRNQRRPTGEVNSRLRDELRERVLGAG